MTSHQPSSDYLGTLAYPIPQRHVTPPPGGLVGHSMPRVETPWAAPVAEQLGLEHVGTPKEGLAKEPSEIITPKVRFFLNNLGASQCYDWNSIWELCLGDRMTIYPSMEILKLGITSNNHHSCICSPNNWVSPKITGIQTKPGYQTWFLLFFWCSTSVGMSFHGLSPRSQGPLGDLRCPRASGCRSFKALAIRAMAGTAKVSRFASVTAQPHHWW